MFQDYLPGRYKASKAFVIDSTDSISDQIDIVIYDQHFSPFILNKGNAIYIPAESVYAVFEVKQNLNKEHIEYAANKIRSVRKLKRTSVPIIHAGGTYPPKDIPHILGGILCSRSDRKKHPFDDRFIEAVAILNKDKNACLDFGCVIESGTFEIKNPPFEKMERKKDPPIEVNEDKATGLLSFFLHFLARLQELGSVPAIDLMEYAKWAEPMETRLHKITQ